ncbi:TPA: MarR family transcriptional regulator [Pseudomonas aeruginosa]|jgi:DNA-binding IclR family transcriptional regulator|uniref:IclR family transcriptional regulator n=1 Tax=Pseudomonas aeruginosa TaxID=287 RepID=UPI0021C753F4|nr:MarR family transcriptional regulator [Pseudomonas aeruginosa]HBO1619924.1 MarR family transcriptional regulator [Pseudomonas aeruginosa]HBO7832661.1 MarR family transcriptional regulator [Pseudomonas aeruginosa]
MNISNTNNSNQLKTLAQGLEALKLLALLGPMKNSEIADRLQLSRPTITRIVKTLIDQGLVYKDKREQLIRLDIGAAVVGLAYHQQSLLIQISHSLMIRFRRETGLSIGITAIDPMTDQGVYLYGLEHDDISDLPGDVGSLHPIMNSAMGRCYLAGLPLYEKHRLSQRLQVGYSAKEWQLLSQKMEKDYTFYQEHGYGKSYGEVLSTLNMIFCEINISGSQYFSLICMGPASQLNDNSIEQGTAISLKATAKEIERAVSKVR